MANILIINTGGTIGMVEGPNGLEPKTGEIERVLASGDSKLAGWQEHHLHWQHWSPLLDSSELQPAHWFLLKQQIEEAEGMDSVLIIHGTDTLSYTAAALSFLLNAHKRPVVITGSMLPISVEGTDAIDNLSLSLQALLAARKEVVICAGGRTLPGSRISKVSTRRFDAFEAPGWHNEHWLQRPAQHPIKFDQPFQAHDIAVMTLYPGLQNRGLLAQLESRPRTLLINAFGNGNSPSHDSFRQILSRAKELSIPVYVRSQCAEGSVDFGLYAASETFASAGAISCGTMPFEAAITKLMLLNSQFDDDARVAEHFQQSLAREWQSLG